MTIGFNVGGATGNVIPDRGFNAESIPTVKRWRFGDGYEQRAADGINNLRRVFNILLSPRPKEEIDDTVAFFQSKNGVDNFDYIFNQGGGEITIKVVCKQWNKTWLHDDFYALSATFEEDPSP